MTLSGWTRLWIVASLAIWIGGFFWLQSVNYPLPGSAEASERFPLRMPPLQPDQSFCKRGPWDDYAQPGSEGARWRLDPEATCRDTTTENWNYEWERWISQSSKAGHFPLIAFGPFILGALMLGIGWVRKGFSSPVDKNKSEAQ
jgi:hypothetical protein